MQQQKMSRKKALAVLGMQEGASKEEIKRAFHRLALQFHPDRNPNLAEQQAKELQAQIAEINEAKSLLLGPDAEEEQASFASILSSLSNEGSRGNASAFGSQPKKHPASEAGRTAEPISESTADPAEYHPGKLSKEAKRYLDVFTEMLDSGKLKSVRSGYACYARKIACMSHEPKKKQEALEFFLARSLNLGDATKVCDGVAELCKAGEKDDFAHFSYTLEIMKKFNQREFTPQDLASVYSYLSKFNCHRLKLIGEYASAIIAANPGFFSDSGRILECTDLGAAIDFDAAKRVVRKHPVIVHSFAVQDYLELLGYALSAENEFKIAKEIAQKIIDANPSSHEVPDCVSKPEKARIMLEALRFKGNIKNLKSLVFGIAKSIFAFTRTTCNVIDGTWSSGSSGDGMLTIDELRGDIVKQHAKKIEEESLQLTRISDLCSDTVEKGVLVENVVAFIKLLQKYAQPQASDAITVTISFFNRAIHADRYIPRAIQTFEILLNLPDDNDQRWWNSKLGGARKGLRNPLQFKDAMSTLTDRFFTSVPVYIALLTLREASNPEDSSPGK